MNDSFDLRRFVEVQAAVYRRVVEELSHGRKQTHWLPGGTEHSPCHVVG
jgi:uncharacterized protein (DUF1810 family)